MVLPAPLVTPEMMETLVGLVNPDHLGHQDQLEKE
jgi:hypothetical protein